MAAVTVVILEPKKIKSVTVSVVSPSICHEVIGPDAMILIFECWVLSQLFHSPLPLSSRGFLVTLHFLRTRVMLSAYLRLLIFSPGDLDYSLCLSSLAFLMQHSAWKLNKQRDNIQPWRTPFPILNQSVFPCKGLTVASSWPAYRFSRRQVRWFGILIS